MKLTISNDYDGQQGVYVCAKPTKESILDILALFEGADIDPKLLDVFKNKAHMTLMYSRKASIDSNDIKISSALVAMLMHMEYWDGHDNDGYVVIKMISRPASNLHDKLLELGAEHSFNEYEAHMTVINNAGTLPRKNLDDFILKTNEILKNTGILIRFNEILVSNCKR